MSAVRFRPEPPCSVQYVKACGSGSGVEHRLAKARVAGSNPVFRSIGTCNNASRMNAIHAQGFAPFGRLGSSFPAGIPSSAFCIPWRHSQVVRQRSAKPRFASSNLAGASKLVSPDEIRAVARIFSIWLENPRRINDRFGHTPRLQFFYETSKTFTPCFYTQLTKIQGRKTNMTSGVTRRGGYGYSILFRT